MGLLDLLAERMNCTYLSDLHCLPRPDAALRRAVADLTPADFSPAEWIDAAEYLCGAVCAGAEEARTAILEQV